MKKSVSKRVARKRGNTTNTDVQAATRDNMRGSRRGYGRGVPIDEGAVLGGDNPREDSTWYCPNSNVESSCFEGSCMSCDWDTQAAAATDWDDPNFLESWEYEEMWNKAERLEVTIKELKKHKGFITLEEARRNWKYDKLAGIRLTGV